MEALAQEKDNSLEDVKQASEEAVQKVETQVTEQPEQEVVEPEKEVIEEQPTYEPNFKFKVYDEEHEIAEWARSAVKDAESEAQVREIFEKAYGIEKVKERLGKVRDDYTGLKSEHENLSQGIAQLSEMYNRGDYDSFFKQLQIPEQKVINWVLEKAKRAEMAPEDRKVLDDRDSYERRLHEIEKQNQMLQQQSLEQAKAAKAQEADYLFNSPEYKDLVHEFDRRVGTPGAFRQQVGAQGDLHWHRTGEDLPLKDVVDQVLRMAGLHATPQMSAPQSAQPQSNAQPQAAQPQAPVIPAVEGQPASPVKKRPGSIEEMRAQIEARYGD